MNPILPRYVQKNVGLNSNIFTCSIVTANDSQFTVNMGNVYALQPRLDLSFAGWLIHIPDTT